MKTYSKLNMVLILQGRVKIPTGGKVRELFLAGTGEIPVPTVKSGWKKGSGE
jgi:hypothetical protein